MEVPLLVVTFVVLSISTLLMTILTYSYIKSKPFGAQTTYDLVYCDLFKIVTAVICNMSFIIVCGLLFRLVNIHNTSAIK